MSKKFKYIGNPDECYICKSTYSLETHHIMNGPYKKASERNGLLIKACTNCHTLSPNAIHNDMSVARKIKQVGQEQYELTHTREEFIKEFGKNYLD